MGKVFAPKVQQIKKNADEVRRQQPIAKSTAVRMAAAFVDYRNGARPS